jgi:hypothetical protein
LKSILAALIALTVAGSASAATVWVAPASQKIRPSMQVPANAPTSAKLAGAQNEFEGFQVVVTGAASGVSMSLSSLDDGKGHTISGRDVTLYREALINVAQQSGADGATGMWPDALVPDVDPIVGEKRNAFPFDVPNGESRAVYADIHAPAGTPTGIYNGVLNVTGGVVAQIPVQLVVWDFAVPSTSSLRTAYGMAWNGPCVGHGDGACSNADEEMKLRARYVQAALDNHVSIHVPYYTATAWGDGREDWSSFDTYAAPFLDGTANTRLQGAKLTAVSVSGDINSTVVGAWARHFKAKGWFSTLFTYICDEPPLTCAWSQIDGRIQQSRAGDPQVQTLVTTTTADAKKNGVTQSIDLYVPVVNFMDDKPGLDFAGNQRASYGATAWWYQSCMSFGCAGVGGPYEGTGESGWPSYAIDTDATRNRAQEWMSFTYNLQGELYYETTQMFFNNDPWTSQFGFGGNGDGTLFYPGTTAKIGGQTEIPVESIRLKGIRDGMEDYELLKMAKDLGHGDEAMALALAVYPRTFQATTTPANIDTARAQLAAIILKALGKTLPQGSTGTTGSDTGSASAVNAAIAGFGGFPNGGCSTHGVQQAWLGLPLVALFVLRRRKAAKN